MVLAVYFVVLLGSCAFGYAETSTDHPDLDGSERFNNFDWRLAKTIGLKEKSNIILSPISVKLVLAMLMEGAGGESSRQLQQALGIVQITRSQLTNVKLGNILKSLQVHDGSTDLAIGSKLFIDVGAKPLLEYEQKLKTIYNATIDQVDFKNSVTAVEKINAWANSVTRGHIKSLISEHDAKDSVVMLLLNAVYFKGNWEQTFPSNQTADGKFYLEDGTTTTAHFMNASMTLKYMESSELGASILRLPYQGSKFAMYIMLPFKRDGLRQMMDQITPDKLRTVLPMMQLAVTNVCLPKFKIEFAASLAPILNDLGITDIFSVNADLTGIAESHKDLVVSNVIQKAGFEINEQGSTAYVVTESDLVSKFGDNTVDFTANHPFVFFIEDETTKTVVFVGKINDPTGIGKPLVIGSPSHPEPTAAPTDGNGLDFKVGGPSTPNLHAQQRFTYLDIELIREFHNREKGNVVISSASIKSILGLLLDGARGNTSMELIRIMRLDRDKNLAQNQVHSLVEELRRPSSKAITKFGSRVLINKDAHVIDAYKTFVKEKYKANIQKVEFSHASEIADDVNSWVNKITNGAIPGIISSDALKPSSALVLLNAIYFQADWKIAFEQNKRPMCFHSDGPATTCTKTTFMTSTGYFRSDFINSLNALVLELPYSDPRYSMILILPKDNLNELMRDLPFNQLLPIIENLTYKETVVEIPKFTIEYTVELSDILKKLGAKELFSEKCNLGDMVQEKDKVSVTSILHKAKIEVNEKGTVAGAASAVFVETLIASSALDYKFDHPFLFFVRDSHTGFLFQGQFTTPEPISGQVS